jgi:hypothetical protein
MGLTETNRKLREGGWERQEKGWYTRIKPPQGICHENGAWSLYRDGQIIADEILTTLGDALDAAEEHDENEQD